MFAGRHWCDVSLSSVKKSITGKSTPACCSDKHPLVPSGCFCLSSRMRRSEAESSCQLLSELLMLFFFKSYSWSCVVTHEHLLSLSKVSPKCHMDNYSPTRNENPHTFRNLSDWLFLSNGSLATSQSLGINNYRTFETRMFKKWITADKWCFSEQQTLNNGSHFHFHASFD